MSAGAGAGDPPPALAAQVRLQARIDRQRMTWWIPAIFVVGLCVSALGLFTSIARLGDGGALRVVDGVFAVFFALFALSVAVWLATPLRIRPRIVPYFAREIEPHGGRSSAAFAHGRRLYLGIGALDELARTAGATPLSAFGFADDYYGQSVHWHAAAAGLRTIAALRHGSAGAELAADLDALAAALDRAAEHGVDFSLVLRLYGRDSLQVVSSREPRQGRFW
jgi:hypothetical protein